MTSLGSHQLRILLTGALYLVSTAAVMRAIHLLIDNPMAATVLGAAAVSLIAARADVKTERFVARARKRVAWGVAIASAATGVGLLVVVATGGSIGVSGVSAAAFFGVAEAVAIGYGHEMWLRGIPLAFAKRAGIADRHAFAFAAMAGVAAIVLEPNARPIGLVLTAASGAAFTALWMRGGDGHGPIAAHVVWVWLTDAVFSGELLIVTQKGGNLTTAHDASGAAAVATALAFAVVTVAVLRNRIPVAKLQARDFPELGAPPDAHTKRTAPKPCNTPKKKRRKKPRAKL